MFTDILLDTTGNALVKHAVNLVKIISNYAINVKMQFSDDTFTLVVLIVLALGFAIGSWFTRMMLRYPFGASPMTGKDAMIGKKARVVDKKNGFLRVFLNSQIWTAESVDYEKINKGDHVTVKAVDNLTLTVEPFVKKN